MPPSRDLSRARRSPVAALQAPLKGQFERFMAPTAIPFVQFTEPAGDPGWFGPDTAIWYVHSHISSFLGVGGGGWMQAIDPFISAALERSNYTTDPAKAIERSQRFMSFLAATVFGSKEVAERAGLLVSRQHAKVSGTMPDGREYSATDQTVLRFNHATFAYGFMRAHQRYHPRPLPDSRVDEYVAQFAVVGEAIAIDDCARTWADVMTLIEDRRPMLALTQNSVDILDLLERVNGEGGRAQSAMTSALHWASMDLLPEWAQKMWRMRRMSRPELVARRAAVKTALNLAQAAAGTQEYILEATRRANAVPADTASVFA